MTENAMEACHQHVVARVTDWNGAFSGGFELVSPHQEIGRRDRTVVLEVVTAGPGNVSRGTRNPCTVRSGDLVVANLLHRSHEYPVFGHYVSTFNWEHIMARLLINEQTKAINLEPLQAYVITKVNEKRAQRVLMGDSVIIAPGGDSVQTGGGGFDERGKPRHQLKVACEEVVAVGTGAVIDGMWQEPECKPGDMVLYDTSVTPITFMVGGKSFTLVHWRAVIQRFFEADGAPEEPSAGG